MSVNQATPLFLAGRLAALLRPLLKADSQRWLDAQLEAAGGPDGRAAIALAFGSAGRKLGQASFTLDADAGLGETATLALANRGLDEAGRVALLISFAAANRTAGAQAELDATIAELFHRGDAREKQAVLRALPLFPESAPLLELGVEAVRSSVQTVFEAIACENAFPAARFSDAQLGQLVLKALFNEVPASRIAGLEKRIQPDLIRMVQGYAAERRAAGRSVPADIEAITAMGSMRSAQ